MGMPQFLAQAIGFHSSKQLTLEEDRARRSLLSHSELVGKSSLGLSSYTCLHMESTGCAAKSTNLPATVLEEIGIEISTYFRVVEY